MNNSRSNQTPGYTEESIVGNHVISSFAMEPGAPYGDPTDVYRVKANSADMQEGNIIFASFEELEEFSRHLAEYVERKRKK